MLHVGRRVVAFGHYVRDVSIQPTVHTLIGIALGMLLVFRTNASYNRVWEGRQLWESLVNESRNLARAPRCTYGRIRS